MFVLRTHRLYHKRLVTADAEKSFQPQPTEHAPISTTDFEHTERGRSHINPAADPGDRNFLHAVPHDEWLQSGFGTYRKTGLEKDQILHYLPPHQLQIIGKISKTRQQHDLSQRLECAIGNDLYRRIIEQDAVLRKPTSYRNIITLGDSVK